MIGYWLKDDSDDVTPVNVSKSSVVSPAKRRKRASGTSYSYVLEGLRIWTEYYVVVAAVTVGQGPFSEPYLARTDEGGNVERFYFKPLTCYFKPECVHSCYGQQRPLVIHC